MSTHNHTAITTGAAANASTINTPLGAIDAAIGNLTALTTTNKNSAVAAINEVRAQAIAGGVDVTNEQLRAWTEAGAYQMITTTYDTTYEQTVSSGTVVWPDGSAGAFTATTINATYEAIDAYTITHTASGKTVTQAAVTRNGDGSITVKPSLTIS